ncbi:MAG: hypothetical protein RBT59_12205 [Arcobacteraceae bacterium]|jgi:hypothetical protein|nr:hypothetical protein [Arcobacteraceae bacterium]
MVRDFNIEISSDYGWEIDIVGFIPPYRAYEIVEDAPISFGVCRKKEGKLIAMYDPNCPKDEAIQEVSKLDIFKETCKFTDGKYTFEGTFIDALQYIKTQYKKDVPKLKDLQKKY